MSTDRFLSCIGSNLPYKARPGTWLLFLVMVSACWLFSCDPQAQRKKRSRQAGNEVEAVTDGVAKDYHKNGKIRVEIPYKNGKKNGVAREYYNTGVLYQEIEYINGIKHGVSKRYYENGKLNQLTQYDSGRRHGRLEKFRSNGSPLSVATYFNDQPCKGLVEYLQDGRVKTNFPGIVIKPIDNLLKEDLYILQLSLSDKSRAVQFYVGELSPQGCLTDALEELPDNDKNGIAEYEIYLPRGMFIMKTISIIAKVKTLQDNYYITERSYRLAVEHY
jgi:hypothetical protein